MPRSVDVLLCTDHLPPSDGGVEQVVEQLAVRLADRGYAVGVFTLASLDEKISLRNRSNVQIFTAKKTDLTQYIGLQSTVSVPAVAEFKRIVEKFRPSLVHVHNRFFFTSYLAALYKSLYDYALVISMHLGDIDYIDGIGGVAARLFQRSFAGRLLQRGDQVICVSEAVQEVAHKLGVSRSVVIPNAVDLDEFRVDHSTFDKTLLYVGRLIRNNGPQDLVDALPTLLHEHPDTTVHIVGGGTLEDQLREKIDALERSDAVTLHGFVPDILTMYARADVFCRPSYSEGLPLTLLESMATYSAPLVTPVAGAREVISDETTGYFVDVGEPDAIAAKLVQLFNRPEELDRVSRAARACVEQNHSWEHRIEDVLEVYEEEIHA